MILIAISMLASASAAAVATPRNESSPEARRVLGAFARCVVNAKRPLASAAMIEDWSMPMMIERQLITSDCLNSGTLNPSDSALKGSIGEWLALTERDEIPPSQVATAPSIIMRGQDFRPASNGDAPRFPAFKHDPAKESLQHQRAILIAKIGECVIRADASGARALLSTTVGSKKEEATAGDLEGSVSQCAPSGIPPALSAEAIRTAVGLSYYRMEMATRGVNWGPPAAAAESPK